MDDILYSPPWVVILNDHEFALARPFTFEWTEGDRTFRITIPAGYPFDGASIPRVCWTVTGMLPTGAHMGAAGVHDYAYQRRGILEGVVDEKINSEWVPVPVVTWTRKKCDEMFKRIMLAAHVAAWKANTMYWAVRAFGGPAWNR